MNRGNLNDGTRDIGNSQAAVLLFRGLDPLSGPQAIHQAMLSSSGPGKEGAKGMKRIILIKDKVTMASFGFAFVEFVDVQVYLFFSYPFQLSTSDISLVGVGCPGCHHVVADTSFRFSHFRSSRRSLIRPSILFSAYCGSHDSRRCMYSIVTQSRRRGGHIGPVLG
jgi:hypothetical protein